MINLTTLQLKYLENKVTANSKNTNHRMSRYLWIKAKKVNIQTVQRIYLQFRMEQILIYKIKKLVSIIYKQYLLFSESKTNKIKGMNRKFEKVKLECPFSMQKKMLALTSNQGNAN